MSAERRSVYRSRERVPRQPESPDELAAAIRRLIEKPAGRRLGRKAPDLREGFTVMNVSGRVFQVDK
jgi:hypothetical protein